MNADNKNPINADTAKINAVSERTIGCAYRVANSLGCGFFEKVYENALVHELKREGLRVEQQKRFGIAYDGVNVGEYVADLVVEDLVIVEAKAVKSFEEVHIAQCLNYLKATGLKLALLLNFGTPKIAVRRIANRF